MRAPCIEHTAIGVNIIQGGAALGRNWARMQAGEEVNMKSNEVIRDGRVLIGYPVVATCSRRSPIAISMANMIRSINYKTVVVTE